MLLFFCWPHCQRSLTQTGNYIWDFWGLQACPGRLPDVLLFPEYDDLILLPPRESQVSGSMSASVCIQQKRILLSTLPVLSLPLRFSKACLSFFPTVCAFLYWLFLTSLVYTGITLVLSQNSIFVLKKKKNLKITLKCDHLKMHCAVDAKQFLNSGQCSLGVTGDSINLPTRQQDPEVGKWSSVTASVRHTVSGDGFCVFFLPVKPTISRAGWICSVLREPELETWSMWQHWSKHSTFRHRNR